MNLKDTLNLPKTDFPMRGDLVKREPQRVAHWKATDLYARIQARNAHGPTFVLHDGPPFTNGNVHIGTALNKILKDSILRYKSMRGFRTPYVPGWDCHGLPIEHKVAQRLREENRSLEPAALRAECAKFSREFIEVQRAQFERLGVLADWAREYRTLNPAYEATILRTFASFVERGLVYRSKKPVYWSIPCETALAEAEVEYLDKTSTQIWVAFTIPADDTKAVQLGLPDNTSVVIWTTTPWTLPANLAIAVHPDVDYVLVESAQGQRHLVAGKLAETFIAEAQLEGATVREGIFRGRDLEGLQPRHPIIDRPSPVLTADYVTTDAGTGAVHTAPGHGMDDYFTGLKHGLAIYCPVNDQGVYVNSPKLPPELQLPESLLGLSVLDEPQKPAPATIAVLKLLAERGALLAKKKYSHSYPHCWRSKTPVVFRALDQWFVGIDRDGLRTRALQAIDAVEWVPATGVKRIRGAVENRPDWCISRQRNWGVPLPAFFTDDGDALLNADVIRALADKVAAHGTDIWFTQSTEALLEGIDIPAEFAGRPLKKGQDTLDVWIDSGCSHRAVLQSEDGMSWPADLYLEGSDQHRGWFQSSLWTAIAADGAAPYRKVLTHGFIVDENGEKISKSKGAMSSDGWVGKYGADLVRLWVASQDFRGDIRLSEGHFKRIQNLYRSLRNTLKFQLGNLDGFDRAAHAVAFANLEPLDRWALMKTAQFLPAVTEAYDAFEFHRVVQQIEYFVGVDLSKLYHDMIKDRLYTYGRSWSKRRSAQTVIQVIFEALVRVLAPILSFTADEAWCFYLEDRDTAGDRSIHLEDWPVADPAWHDDAVAADIAAILELREPANEQLERLRADGVIGQALDAKLTFHGTAADPQFQCLCAFEADLPEIFIVSQVELRRVEGGEVSVTAEHASGVRCPRSWRWVPELVAAGDFGEVSPRDRDALLNP